MYKARLTETGARHLGTPHLAGKTIDYESLHDRYLVILEAYYGKQRIGSTISYGSSGEEKNDPNYEPECVLLTRPERNQ